MKAAATSKFDEAFRNFHTLAALLSSLQKPVCSCSNLRYTRIITPIKSHLRQRPKHLHGGTMNPNLQSAKVRSYKNLLLGKLSCAVVSSIASQLFVLVAYIFVLHFSPLAPYESLVSFVDVVTSLGTWVLFLIFMSLIFAQSVICAKVYVVSPSYPSTRFQRYTAYLSLRNFVLGALHVVVGTATVWLFVLLGEFDDGDLPWLYGFGAWISLHYCLREYGAEKRVVFPVVHQAKWPQFKVTLLPVLNESRRAVLRPTCYFLAAYVVVSIGFSKGSNSTTVYLLAAIFGVIIYFNLNLMTYFFELFLTEPIEFPIADDECLTLSDAVSVDVPIVQHLAGLDLFLMSGGSRRRREQLYALSNPGGHPHNWNALVANVLTVLKTHTDALNKSTAKPPTLPRPPPPPQLNRSYANMRNASLNLSGDVARLVETDVIEPRRPNELVAALKRRLGVDFLFAELPEANVFRCLGNGQVLIWLTQALSTIAARSVVEDKYGVVQKDLPAIISGLVELGAAVEKAGRSTCLSRRGPDDRMRAAVTSAIRRSLQNICDVFGPYLKHLNLKRDVLLQLQAFAPTN